MSPNVVTVNLGPRTYPIRIQPGCLADVGPELNRILGPGLAKRATVVTDSNVGPLYAARVLGSLGSVGILADSVTVQAGESSKSLQQADVLYDRFLDFQMERTSAVLALGGGVVGDLAGFVAATYLCGVPLVMLPTSLLAFVDSAVGGKVAVNHPRAKNIIGAFYQPRIVFVDPDVLSTLPRRELVSGISEVIKYGVILDAEFFGWLEAHMSVLLKLSPDALAHVIERCCRLKADVVSRDETESGPRMILNYGHTVAHAVEAVTAYGKYLHGEAVSIGMNCAAMLAGELGVLDRSIVRRQKALLVAAGLPTGIEGLSPQALMEAMNRDKKVRAGRVRFVLPHKLGEVVVHDDVPGDVVLSVLNKAQNE